MGFYYKQLRSYFDIFDKNQIKIFLYDELKHNSVKMLRDIFVWLDIDCTFIPKLNIKYNISGLPISQKFHDYLRKPDIIKNLLKQIIPVKIRKHIKYRLQNKNIISYSKIDRAETKMLLDIYLRDISMLETLIRRDLLDWKKTT